MGKRFEPILKLLKNEAMIDLGKLEVENTDRVRKQLNHYFDIFESIHQLSEISEEVDLEEENKKLQKQSIQTAEKSEKNEESDKNIGRFERTLAGGFIRTPEGDIQLTETILRKTEIEHRDKVLMKGTSPKSSNLKVIEKANNGEKSRRQDFTYGLVTFNENLDRLVVEKNIDGEKLRIEEVPQFYIPSYEEVDFYSLEEGDVVDIAWYTHHARTMKIIWKHHTYSEKVEGTLTQAERMLNHRKQESVESSDKEKAQEESARADLLEGKHVVLLGLEPMRDKYKNLVLSHGGTFDGVDSSYTASRREAVYDDADVIIAGLSHISHEATNHAVDYAKKINTPFTSFSGFGGGMFLMALWDALDINPNQASRGRK